MDRDMIRTTINGKIMYLLDYVIPVYRVNLSRRERNKLYDIFLNLFTEVVNEVKKDESNIEIPPYWKNFAKKDTWDEFKNRVSDSYLKNPKVVKKYWEKFQI